ncbi:hypothetical protein ASPZODRAFT_1500690 [Penicilliopsis zonata CBS 506.65]|uniref:Enoyl reductase (ER) domain-containing protein n=1 Tax=Penicilliopsis zonata CBS 506.65 TaxID=1073090 RepID=A0A1L9S593_9EURO|nr:hypothetical protein ASPZODRAFT_1500690 [Penicilliopsis zonata CBS 506.65]OJJ42321.1 hypothetical protein ASPZODRAFT_1500690 [Penicilliopsis zonata CBS 506.65]
MQNKAAFIDQPRQTLSVREAPYTPPTAHQIVIRNRAIAINHIDWKIQENPEFAPLRYPGILGHESAGEVVAVGSAVTRFAVGDRVLAEGTAMATSSPAEGSFQLLTVVPEHVVCRIPDSLSFARATVLPLGVSTAAMGLYAAGTLELAYPSCPKAESRGETIIVWGGSSSVGSNVIQLAVQAGYEVVATASPHNFDYVRGLGATAVFDYHEESVVEDLVAAVRGKTVIGGFDAVGYDAAGVSASTPLSQVLSRTEDQSVGKQHTRCKLVSVHPAPRALPEGIEFKMAWAVVPPELGLAIYRDFLPGALEQGTYRAVPEPVVVGHGLEAIQGGVDVLKRGVSARKIVVLVD